jgi:hypothetical protein
MPILPTVKTGSPCHGTLFNVEMVMVQIEETGSCCAESSVAESEILDLQFAFSTVHTADQVEK